MNRFFALRSGASLRRQILMIFNLGLWVFTSLLILAIDYSIRQSTIKQAGEGQIRQAAFFASLVDSDMEQSLASISSLAVTLHALGLTENRPLLQDTLNSLQRSMPKFSWIGFADPKGTVQAATRGMLLGNSVATRPWFITAQVDQTVVDVHEATMLADMLKEPGDSAAPRFVDVASPVRDPRGVRIGVLGAHLSAKWLDSRFTFYSSAMTPQKTARPFVIGSDGAFRFGNLDRYQALQGQANFWHNRESQGFVLVEDATGNEILVSYAKHASASLPNTMGWVTVIATPTATVLGPALTTRLLAASGVVGLAVLAWLMMVWLLRWVHQPVRQLIQAIDEVQQTGGSLRPLDGLPREFEAIRLELNKLLGTLVDREHTLQAALDQIRNSFTGVTRNFPGVLFSLEDCRDGCFDFTYLSDSVTEYFKLDGPPPRIAQAFFEQVLVDNSPAQIEKIRQILQRTEPIDFVLKIRGKEGEARHVRFKGYPRPLANGAKAWDGVAVDVTDLVTAQQSATAADEAKSRFLATMSHEIRTPLNGILGFAQILQQELTDPQARKDVQKIIDTADTLTRILNDVLDFSKVEAGKVAVEARPFTFVEMANALSDIFSVEARQRSIDFGLNLSGRPEQTLLGDPTRLRQILTNLVSNAMKFTSQGRVQLSIAVADVRQDRCAVQIIVQDTGIGMSTEHLQRLFTPFEQSDSSTYRRFGGSGLGLAIVKGLLDAMGGTIRVDSRLSQGTTFTLDLGFPAVQHSASVSEPVETGAVRPLKILVVDDVAINRDIICRGLRRDGHTFQQAADGQEAVRLAQADTFDLILMDLEMPVMDGFKATREIRQGGPNIETCIFALSGFAFEKDIARVLGAGMNRHLAKPINLQVLRTAMREQFGES